MTTYYRILDKNLIGRTDGPGFLKAFIYQDGKGWARDQNIISDRLMGYDPDDDGLGHSSVMDNIEEITEEAALGGIKARENS
jgi:hypothetical protein